MDVAAGATDVPFPRKFLIDIPFVFLLWFFIGIGSFFSQRSYAIGESSPIHFSGDKQLWNRKENRVELFGHAAFNQPGETLTADYILLDLNARTIDARSNCIYIVSDTVIWGEEMHFNLDTRTGTVVEGRISTDTFTLRGERINKLGEGRFQTHWGDYTTCHDCSPSWTLQGEDVDMQIDGYAYLSNVYSRIKDAPAFWMPYLIVPMKTRRQTGFLFPQFGSSASSGATFVFPFFWAIDRSVDMTFGLGEYTERGHRLEWEGRYAISPRSSATTRFFYLTDRQFIQNRWAIDIAQTQELPWGIEEKLQFTELSDNIYPFYFGSDVPRAMGEAFLPSSLSFSRGSPDVSAFVTFQRNRNLLNSIPGPQSAQLLQFDPRTVQAFPNAVLTTHDRFLFDSPFLGGVSFGFSNFTRSAGPFDYSDPSVGGSVKWGTPPPPGLAPQPGIDPIREAVRFSVTPSLYTTLRPFDVVSVVPSLQYHQYFYDFHGQIPSLNRGYLLFQTDLSTQLERIYEFPDDENIPRAKHLIRPILTYSYIPPMLMRENNNHPFIQQIKQTGRPNFISGYNFDNNDIVPYTYQQTSANYFVPLGNSLAYGFSTQWIRRRGALTSEAPSYQTVVEFNAGQALNFLELTDPVNPNSAHPFTRFFSGLKLDMDHFSSATTYYYYPDYFPAANRHTVSTTASYFLERGFHQRILTFDRSISVGYSFNKINGVTSNLTSTLNFSLNDYILPTGSISYGFEPNTLYSAAVGVQLQSPSRCWKLGSGLSYRTGVPGVTLGLDISLNLTGSGFGGVGELASQAQSSVK